MFRIPKAEEVIKQGARARDLKFKYEAKMCMSGVFLLFQLTSLVTTHRACLKRLVHVRVQSVTCTDTQRHSVIHRCAPRVHTHTHIHTEV